MDAQKFLAEFGHIANAPGGVEQLRQMIYHLAITGKLTLQNENDGSAQSLLTEISATRNFLISKKKYKRFPKLESEVLEPQHKIVLPTSWCWTRLLDIGEISPKNEAADEVPASFIPMSGIPQLHLGNLAIEATKWKNIKKGFTHFANGDVVVAKITPCFENGKAAIINGLPHTIGAGTTELHVFRPIHDGVLSGYIYLFLRSPYFAVEGEKNMTGTAGQKRLPTEYFATRAMPLPPTAEQSRIVAKVDELMALCDKLETQQQARRKLQNALRLSTLQAVAAASSTQELQKTWARLADNFRWLFNRHDDTEDLKKAVLDLAVSGYLSESKVSDTPASSLKSKIFDARKGGIAGENVARKKQVKAEELNETVFPAHWETIILDDAISTIDAGWSPTCLPTAREDENKWGVLKTTSVQTLRFLPLEHKELPSSLHPRPQYQVQVGDILITRAGPKNRVGICCVVEAAPPKLMISDKIIRFHIVGDLIDPHFVALCLSAGEPGRILEKLQSGMDNSQMNISQDKLRSITIPLPPIEEQLRILEKIQSIMLVINKFHEQLRKAAIYHNRVATMAVTSLTGLTTAPTEEPMKAPQTELIANLHLGRAPDIKAQAPLAALLARNHGKMPAKDLWQRYGGEIDAFYAQLKVEVAHGWIVEPVAAEMREKQLDSVSA